MPLKLRAVLGEAQITHRVFGDAVTQSDGRPMSDAMTSLLLGRGIWPKKTPRAWIEKHTRELLREVGSPHADDSDLFELDEERVAAAAPQAAVAPSRNGGRRASITARRSLVEPLEVEMLHPLTKKHFSLFRDPFQDDVNSPEDVFLSDEQRYIREAMFTTAKHGGLLAVCGESGAGKSVLRRDMLARIARDGHAIRVIFPQSIDKKKMTASNIAEAIIKDLQPNASVRNSLEAKARQIKEVLMSSSRAGNTHVLLIEEAHDLSIDTLKYLKRFYEVEDVFKRLLSIILVGQPELRTELLDESKNWEAREVIRRFEIAQLEPLSNSLEAYVAHKFRRCDVDVSRLLAADAYAAINNRLVVRHPSTRQIESQLYPLVVNNLITKALNRAAELGVPVVDANLIKEI